MAASPDQAAATPQAAPTPEETLAAFWVTLRQRTPRLLVTPAVMAINVALFGLMVGSGVDVMSPTTDSLLRWGADHGPRVWAGQWWRLLTNAFIHIGVIHLLLNMAVLMQIGQLVERMLGNVRFLAVYLIAALWGSTASLLWNPFTVSAGASGAVFGVYGVFLGYLLRDKGSIPPALLRKLRNGALTFVGYNVLYGLANKNVDMAAHAGGFLGGMACTLIAGWATTTRATAALISGLLLLPAAALALAPPAMDPRAEARRFDEVQSRVAKAINQAWSMRHEKKINDDEAARIIEEEAVAPQRAADQRLGGRWRVFKGSEEFVAVLRQNLQARASNEARLVKGLRAHDDAMAQAALDDERKTVEEFQAAMAERGRRQEADQAAHQKTPP